MKTTYKNYTIKSEYKGDKAAPWGVNWKQENWNRNIIHVRNTKTKTSIRFDFWGSIVSPELQSPYDLKNAFYCFISDAISGLASFDDFCSEFGYNTDSRTAEKIWKSCKKSTEKAKRIIDEDIYDFANELQKIAG